jgi:hypothetical protein
MTSVDAIEVADGDESRSGRCVRSGCHEFAACTTLCEKKDLRALASIPTSG